MVKLLIICVTFTMMFADDGFSIIEAETIGMSLVAIFIYVVVRLKTIMSKKDECHNLRK